MQAFYCSYNEAFREKNGKKNGCKSNVQSGKNDLKKKEPSSPLEGVLSVYQPNLYLMCLWLTVICHQEYFQHVSPKSENNGKSYDLQLLYSGGQWAPSFKVLQELITVISFM